MYKLLHKIFGFYMLSMPLKEGIRFVNILNKHNILFWGLKKQKDYYTIKASLFSCEAVIKTADAEGINTEIIKTVGIPFVFTKYKGRYGLILGSILGLFLIFYSELLIWEISVTGNKKVDDKVIITALREYGVKRGAFIPDISILKAEEKFLLENKDISSIAINIKGTYAEIDLLERTYPPDIIDIAGYYNIVAAEDGIIVRVEAAEGRPEVKVGDAVVKGQLLINSFLPGNYGTYRLTHAAGEVYANVTEKYSISIPLEQTEKIYTGETKTIKLTTVMGRSVNLFTRTAPPFEYYDIETTEYEKKLFGAIKTPVEIEKAVFKEYRINRYRIKEDDARLRANDDFKRYLDRQEDEVISYECDGFLDKKTNAYILNASVVILKNIAEEKPIELKPIYKMR